LEEHENSGSFLPTTGEVPDRIVFRGDPGTALGRLIMATYVTRGTGILPTTPMRVYPTHAFTYLLKGQGSYYDANGYRQAVRAGDFILIFPDLPHMYTTDPGTHWDEFYMVFDGPQIALLRETGLLDPRRPVHHLAPIDYWLGRFHEVITTTGPSPAAASARRIAHLVDVFAEALSGARRIDQPDEPWWFDEAKRLLETHFEEHWDIEEVARKIGVPYDQFRRAFRAAAGVSPALYRNRRRTLAACELLQYTQMPLRQIAETLGFADEFHFSNRFKQGTGVSPREYRKSLVR
jgi:AraC-like DNA-binding protein